MSGMSSGPSPAGLSQAMSLHSSQLAGLSPRPRITSHCLFLLARKVIV